MAANKVIVNNQTILDLTADTVTAATLKKGVTAHDASGAQITGTMEEASTSETWVLDSTSYFPDDAYNDVTFNADFTSNGISFSSIQLSINIRRQIMYDSTVVKSFDSWASEVYRKLTFATAPTGDLLAWLEKYGVKQPANLAVQPSKDVTITSNGTTEIMPDAPYDVMEKANVTVNVASGGAGFSVTFPATAANWNLVSDAYLLLSDGTVKSFFSYSEVSGKTIENVVGIYCVGSYPAYVLKMTLSEGSMAQCTIGAPQSTTYRITNSNGTTIAFYGAGNNTFWWPLADTVISAIEMYNTD